MNWRDYSYLKSGSARQRRAYTTLASLNLFDTLRPFDPALVSTVCLELDVPGSDLDVICELTTPAAFETRVCDRYEEQDGFRMWSRPDGERVARFDTAAFPVEIFAKEQPVEQQYAWRHLTVMARLLAVEPALRDQVRSLKREGYATEAAFAEVLGLEGDPYEALLTLEEATERQLTRRCHRVRS